MSPRVFREGELIFWFHSYDALNENRASIHVGKSSQNDTTDAKIGWNRPLRLQDQDAFCGVKSYVAL